ncbi:serine protease easter-like isoform X1 [Leptotrombidium deliense]|uniref:Serine protease easter-like isoform X1 n=1 Tax=Leptotrombidium deliense TaxID=299467 RepID=A0A443SBW9_9ACAR|nr:serine protease easter-like isoform X1 [Leptotrombidium deliense]
MQYCGQIFSCGASIIDKNHLITAAHCVDKAEKVFYKVGTNIAPTSTDNMTEAQCYFVHERWNSEALSNDIAIIRLNEELDFNEPNIGPICLQSCPCPNSGACPTITENTEFVVAGWGVTNVTTGDESDVLMETSLHLQDFSVCNNAYGGLLNCRKHFCVGDVGHSTCMGDSGGPVMQCNDGRYNLWGIISFGDESCAATNSVNTYVPCYYHWIITKMNEQCPAKKKSSFKVRKLSVKSKLRK